MPAFGNKYICRLYVAVDNAGGVSGIQSVGDLDRPADQYIGIDWSSGDAML